MTAMTIRSVSVSQLAKDQRFPLQVYRLPSLPIIEDIFCLPHQTKGHIIELMIAQYFNLNPQQVMNIKPYEKIFSRLKQRFGTLGQWSNDDNRQALKGRYNIKYRLDFSNYNYVFEVKYWNQKSVEKYYPQAFRQCALYSWLEQKPVILINFRNGDVFLIEKTDFIWRVYNYKNHPMNTILHHLKKEDLSALCKEFKLASSCSNKKELAERLSVLDESKLKEKITKDSLKEICKKKKIPNYLGKKKEELYVLLKEKVTSSTPFDSDSKEDDDLPDDDLISVSERPLCKESCSSASTRVEISNEAQRLLQIVRLVFPQYEDSKLTALTTEMLMILNNS